jgi:TonB family protein
MSEYLASLTTKRARQRRKKAAIKDEIAIDQAAPKMKSVANREAALAALQAASQNQKKKEALTPRRIAIVTSIALHAIGALIGTIYIVQQTVFDDEVVSVQMMQAAPKPALKRMSRPRVAQRPQAPKPLPAQKLALQQTPAAASARIPVGNERFTLPSDLLSSASIIGPSGAGLDRGLLARDRQAQIASIPTTFEAPRMTGSALSRFNTMTSFAEINFSPDALDPVMTTAELGAATQSFSEYLREIRAKIKSAQRFPPTVREAIDGTTKVRFTIRRDGALVDFKIVESSGSRALDNAALDAVRNAAPFPAFPQEQKGEHVQLELPINFQVKA